MKQDKNGRKRKSRRRRQFSRFDWQIVAEEASDRLLRGQKLQNENGVETDMEFRYKYKKGKMGELVGNRSLLQLVCQYEGKSTDATHSSWQLTERIPFGNHSILIGPCTSSTASARCIFSRRVDLLFLFLSFRKVGGRSCCWPSGRPNK